MFFEMKKFVRLLYFAAIPFFSGILSAAVLEVGDDKSFDRIESALARASEGDEIVVFPKKDGTPYRRVALLVRVAKLTIRTEKPGISVVLDGDGFEYSGRGSVPRAIVQFDPGADACLLDGFTLVNARNESFNGAGVRINQANDITIRNCTIRDNDMGIMSGGDFSKRTGARQMIENCRVFRNGTEREPGYNHNLYLGGTDVTVKGCLIENSVTGHNIKSRAHRNYILYNIIRNSANRELDLVDAEGNTDVPGSDALLIGNRIVKDPKCKGNRAVIHFGRDGNAEHDGTLWLIFNTIETPFAAPVAEVDSGKGVVMIENRIDDAGAGQNGVLADLRKSGMKASGKANDVRGNFIVQKNGLGQKIGDLESPPEIPEHVRKTIDSSKDLSVPEFVP